MSAVRFHAGSRPINEWVFAALVAGSFAACAAALFILRKAWDLDRFTRPFVLMIFFLYLGLTLGAFAQHFAGKPGADNPTLRNVVGVVSFQGVSLILVWRFTREHETSWNEGFGFSVNWTLALLFGVLAACIFLPVGMLLKKAAVTLIVAIHMEPQVQPAVEALAHTVTWLDRAAFGIVTIAIVPPAEELMFRGILYRAIKGAGYPRLALWGTSLLFAGIHRDLAVFVPLFLFAVLLVKLYDRTNNLLAPVAAHVVFNAANFVAFFLVEESGNTSPPHR